MFYFSLLHLSVILHFESIQFKRSGLFYSFRTKKNSLSLFHSKLYIFFLAVCVYFSLFFMAFFYAFFSLWFMKIDMISSQVYCSCRRTTIGMSFCICAWNTYKFTYDLGRSHSFTFILTQNSAHRKSSNDGSHIIRTCVQSNWNVCV